MQATSFRLSRSTLSSHSTIAYNELDVKLGLELGNSTLNMKSSSNPKPVIKHYSLTTIPSDLIREMKNEQPPNIKRRLLSFEEAGTEGGSNYAGAADKGSVMLLKPRQKQSFVGRFFFSDKEHDANKNAKIKNAPKMEANLAKPIPAPQQKRKIGNLFRGFFKKSNKEAIKKRQLAAATLLALDNASKVKPKKMEIKQLLARNPTFDANDKSDLGTIFSGEGSEKLSRLMSAEQDEDILEELEGDKVKEIEKEEIKSLSNLTKVKSIKETPVLTAVNVVETKRSDSLNSDALDWLLKSETVRVPAKEGDKRSIATKSTKGKYLEQPSPWEEYLEKVSRATPREGDERSLGSRSDGSEGEKNMEGRKTPKMKNRKRKTKEKEKIQPKVVVSSPIVSATLKSLPNSMQSIPKDKRTAESPRVKPKSFGTASQHRSDNEELTEAPVPTLKPTKTTLEKTKKFFGESLSRLRKKRLKDNKFIKKDQKARESNLSEKSAWSIKFVPAKKRYCFYNSKSKQFQEDLPSDFVGSVWVNKFDLKSGKKLWLNVLTNEESENNPGESL